MSDVLGGDQHEAIRVSRLVLACQIFACPFIALTSVVARRPVYAFMPPCSRLQSVVALVTTVVFGLVVLIMLTSPRGEPSDEVDFEVRKSGVFGSIGRIMRACEACRITPASRCFEDVTR